MRLCLSVLLLAIPLAPLLAGLAARRAGGAVAHRVVPAAATLAAALAGLAVLAFLLGGPVTARWAAWPGRVEPAVALRLDMVSAIMALLVSALGAVVLRFSRRYLAGDPAEAAFHSWMSLTLGSVLTLVLSGHLLLLAAAWIATSLCLHQLLLHYPQRPGAVFSARKKFVFSRLGDACLLAAAAGLHLAYGTWDLAGLFAAAEAGRSSGLNGVGYLLVACAAFKSAQFPWHSWLPDTMETPTPVSAFMHAGIINAGGFLLIRLAPLLTHAPAALHAIAVVGAVTAGFGGVVMLAQPSVKRALAYSTIAQMGFMLLQCGLGAFGLALLHLVAHSLYKAHAFLRSGSTVGGVPRAAIALRPAALTLGALASLLLVTGLATLMATVAPAVPVRPDLFALVLVFALAYGLARAWSAAGRRLTIGRGLAVALAVALASLALHAGAQAVLPDASITPPPPALLAFIGGLFSALYCFQAILWRAGRHPLGRRCYVHALNGFYVSPLANRLLLRLWPHQA